MNRRDMLKGGRLTKIYSSLRAGLHLQRRCVSSKQYGRRIARTDQAGIVLANVPEIPDI